MITYLHRDSAFKWTEAIPVPHIHSGSAAPNWTISKGGRIRSAAALVKGAAGRTSNK